MELFLLGNGRILIALKKMDGLYDQGCKTGCDFVVTLTLSSLTDLQSDNRNYRCAVQIKLIIKIKPIYFQNLVSSFHYESVWLETYIF